MTLLASSVSWPVQPKFYFTVEIQFIAIKQRSLIGADVGVTVATGVFSVSENKSLCIFQSCMLWFLCYPVIVVVSRVFSEYLRYKVSI